MKNKLFICFLISGLFLLSNYLHSEDLYDQYKIGFNYNYIKSSLSNTNQFGLNLEYFITRNISLNYSFALGELKNQFIFHCHAGLAGGIYLLFLNEDTKNSNNDLLNYGSVLLAFVPEGINFYFPLNENTNICPMLYPFGFDYLKDKYSVTSTVGMKIEMYLSDIISINPFISTTIFYKENTFLFNAGISLGINF